MVIALQAVRKGNEIIFKEFFFSKPNYSTFCEVENKSLPKEITTTPDEDKKDEQISGLGQKEKSPEKNTSKMDLKSNFKKNIFFFRSFKKKDIKIFKKFLKKKIVKNSHLKITRNKKNTVLYINSTKIGKLDKSFPYIVKLLKNNTNLNVLLNNLMT